MLRSLFFGSGEEKNKAEESVVPDIEHDQKWNRYTDIMILNGHTDLVHTLIKVDQSRVLSLADDRKAIVWDCKNCCRQFKFSGHEKSITCALVLGGLLRNPMVQDHVFNHQRFSNVVATASSDETIRIWDLGDGRCQKIITEHESTVKCFTVIRTKEIFILSAGQDLCLWDQNFNLLAKHSRNSLDYIHTVVNVREDRVVTATDCSQLVVYEIKMRNEQYTIKEFKRLSPHRRSITVLRSVSASTFASASVDGAIVVWTCHRLEMARKFNHYDQFMMNDHTYPYIVQDIVVLEQRYIISTIGCGFAIFDTVQDRCIVKQTTAHFAQLTRIAVLDKGSFVATSSLDGRVRIWGSPADTNFTKLTGINRLLGTNVSECKKFPLKLHLLGECRAHSNSVQDIVECEDEGFVSCGIDGSLILWKNSDVLRQRKEEKMLAILSHTAWLEH